MNYYASVRPWCYNFQLAICNVCDSLEENKSIQANYVFLCLRNVFGSPKWTFLFGWAWLRMFTNRKHESPHFKRDSKSAITMVCTFVTMFLYRLMARYSLLFAICFVASLFLQTGALFTSLKARSGKTRHKLLWNSKKKTCSSLSIRTSTSSGDNKSLCCRCHRLLHHF